MKLELLKLGVMLGVDVALGEGESEHEEVALAVDEELSVDVTVPVGLTEELALGVTELDDVLLPLGE